MSPAGAGPLVAARASRTGVQSRARPSRGEMSAFRSRLALATTLIELIAMAASAISGCRSPSNATGMASVL